MAIAWVAGAETRAVAASGNLTFAVNATGVDKLVVSLWDNQGAGLGNITGVTYAGVSMTLAVSLTDTATRPTEAYYLDAPTTGSNNVVISRTVSVQEITASSEGYSGTATGIGNTGTSAYVALGTSATVSVTVSANSWLVGTIYASNGGFTATSGVIRQTWGDSNTRNVAMDSNTALAAGTRTLAATFANADNLGIAFEIMPLGATGVSALGLLGVGI